MQRTLLQSVKGYGILLIVAVLGGAWIHETRIPSDAELATRVAAHVGFQAPDLTLVALDGQSISLSDLHGKIVLINFWATWCPPCRAEMESIQEASEGHRDDFVVLAINNHEGEEIIRRFVAETHLSLPVLLDTDGAVARRYNVQALPTSLFVDRMGIVRAANFGAMSRAYIEAQLALLGAR